MRNTYIHTCISNSHNLTQTDKQTKKTTETKMQKKKRDVYENNNFWNGKYIYTYLIKLITNVRINNSR